MPYEIRIPRLGWSMEEGTFLAWLKKPGDAVAVGEALFEFEGEKAAQQIESIDAGTLFIPPNAPAANSVVAVGALVGYLLEPGEAPPIVTPAATSGEENYRAMAPTKVATKPTAPVAGPAVRRLAREMKVDLAQAATQLDVSRITRDDVLSLASRSPSSQTPIDVPLATSVMNAGAAASPRAKRISRELGIDWRSIGGSGKNGRVRESDVRAAKRFASSQSGESLTLTPRRTAIAQQLRKSREQTIPVTITTLADAGNLVALREQFKSAQSTIIPSYTDVLACLVANVMKRHTPMARVWNPDGKSLRSVVADDVHIGLAVDTPAGLLVPSLRNVAQKSLRAVAEESKLLIEQGRAGRLATAQMQGSVITLTNLGAYGINGFTPIINYPEIAILGIGAIRREAIVLSDDRIVVGQRLTLSLTFDHAAIDGAPAAAFLQAVADAIANPAAHLLGG